MEEYKTKMNEEISLRLESDSWNLSIAGRVLSEKNARKEKTIFRSYVTSLAAASVFLLLFIFNVYSYISSSTDTSIYNSYQYSYNSDSDSINTEETDLIINEAFPMR
jgi:hypothetical protein